MVESQSAAAFEAPQALSPTAAGPSSSENLRRAYRWARAGYALVPGVAAALVAVPATVLMWTTLVRGEPFSTYHAWFLLCLIPAALLILSGWVRFERPDGLPIAATEAPELFTLIEQVRTYLGAPAIDAVYLTESFAVCAVQRPSRGLFGGLRNEIVIGLPLLQSVSKAEAAVLIAHELSHVANRQSAMAAAVHRARVTWQQMIERQPRQPLYLRVPFQLVTGGFARKFLRISAVQERTSVFTADRLATEIAGLGSVGSALLRIQIAEEFLAEYWRRLAEEPVTTPDPQLNPHREMADFLPRMSQWERATEVLEMALHATADNDPSHPTLAERLEALGIVPGLPQPVMQPATKLLGPALERTLDHFDTAWRKAAAPACRAAFDKLSPETKRLLDLDALAAVQPLDLFPAIERAKLAYFAGGLEAASARYADLTEWHPEDGRAALAAGIAMVDGGHSEAAECLRQALAFAPRTDWTKAAAEDWFAVGEALLARGEDIGIDCLEQAIRIDPARSDLAAFLVDRYLDGPANAVNAA